jgi:calcium-dependent protein kinase
MRPFNGVSSEGTSSSASSTSSEDSGRLDEIFGKLESRTGKISLAGRCHQLPRKLDHDYIMSSKVLGVGYNGKVHLARSRIDSKQTVAVKTFRLKGLSESKKERLIAETSVFLCMDHPHVARLLDVYETENHMSLVMECMEGGELFERVTHSKRFTESQAADVIRQMLLGLHYLHCHGIVHRDMKLENFLFDSQDGNHLKMIDFGFSKFTDTKGRMKTSCGTLAYVAPEVLKRSYTSQCDLWSMGVMVFILLSGRMPFYGDSDEQIVDIKKGRYVFRKEQWSNVSQDAQSFTKALLEMDPAKRLTARGALEHHWLKQTLEAMPKPNSSIFAALRTWTMAPKLHRACMSVMAWSLGNKHHAQVRAHFLALDADHNGSISLHELKEAMLPIDCWTEDELSEVFDLLTHGQNGEVHYSDFLAAMACSHLELDDNLLQATFNKFDSTDSGFIAPMDLERILGTSFEGQDAVTLLRDGDLKGDGRLDYSSFSDFIRSSRDKLLAKQCAGNTDSCSGAPGAGPVLLGHPGVRYDGDAPLRKPNAPLVQKPKAPGARVVSESAEKAQPACCTVQ